MICLLFKPFLNDLIVSAHTDAFRAVSGDPSLTISIVSHGHADLVQALVERLSARHEGQVAHVVITHNLPESALTALATPPAFRVTELFNPTPQGFGTNHNRAFDHCETAFFCVLNPDVELPPGELWTSLLEVARIGGTGCAYPQLLNLDGSVQDNEREVVTPWALVRRHLLRRPQAWVDWVSAAFWVVPSAVYRSIGGFDERYFMYCEDTDFCLRLRLAGRSLRRAPVRVVHAASRSSRRPGKLLARHLRSLFRLWTGVALRHYIARLGDGSLAQTPRQ